MDVPPMPRVADDATTKLHVATPSHATTATRTSSTPIPCRELDTLQHWKWKTPQRRRSRPNVARLFHDVSRGAWNAERMRCKAHGKLSMRTCGAMEWRRRTEKRIRQRSANVTLANYALKNEHLALQQGMHFVLLYGKAQSLPRGSKTTMSRFMLSKDVPSIDFTFVHALETVVCMLLSRDSKSTPA